MSYILDALKRADAERGQTLAPNLGEPKRMPASEIEVRRGNRLVRWGVAIALLGGAGVAYFVWPYDSVGEPTQAVGNPAPISPQIAPIAAQPPATPAVVASEVAPKPAPQISSLPEPVQPILAKAHPQPQAQAKGQPPSSLLPRPRPSSNAPGDTPARAPQAPATERPAPAPAPVASQPAAPAAPISPAVPAVQEKSPALSAAQRAGMPQITISGSSYSTNPAHRMLIANNQVVKEGQELSPGLTLEVIGPRSAVFNQGGTRFNVNY